jgi:hypothetical protein
MDGTVESQQISSSEDVSPKKQYERLSFDHRIATYLKN